MIMITGYRKRRSRLKRIIAFLLILAALQFAAVEVLLAVNGVSADFRATEYVIILGAAVWGDKISPSLDERLKTGAEYLEKYPDSIAVVSGGQGRGENMSEAEAMKRYLVARGIKEDRIIKEDKSTSTMENFKYSGQILRERTGGAVGEITVITSDFHMFRTKMLAKRNGFTPFCISSRTPASVVIPSYFREYFALIKSWLFDR